MCVGDGFAHVFPAEDAGIACVAGSVQFSNYFPTYIIYVLLLGVVRLGRHLLTMPSRIFWISDLSLLDGSSFRT